MPTANSQSSLISVEEALKSILENIKPLALMDVPLTDAYGRALARSIASPVNLPHFANSSMDGFAVRAEDTLPTAPGKAVTLHVLSDIPAGTQPGVRIEPGQSARIMTGAVIPDGADAVVPVEDTDYPYRQIVLPLPKTVQINKPATPGAYIRTQGQDVQIGSVVLDTGKVLRSQEIGFLGMLGITTVQVPGRPRVAVFSTGDELVPAGQALTPGKIFDANSYSLVSLVRAYGGEAITLGIVRDDEHEVRSVLDQAVSLGVDLIISSAGVSVGAFDYVRRVIETQGELSFWRVNIRPGKPFAFGSYRQVPFFGLPGNPVSAFVGFEVFVRPALLKLSGFTNLTHPSVRAILSEPVESDGRESYLRGRIWQQQDQWFAGVTGHQDSGNMRSLVEANALLVIPSGVKSMPAGSRVTAWVLGGDNSSLADFA